MSKQGTTYPDDKALPPLPGWLTHPEKVFRTQSGAPFKPTSRYWISAFEMYAAAYGMAQDRNRRR